MVNPRSASSTINPSASYILHTYKHTCIHACIYMMYIIYIAPSVECLLLARLDDRGMHVYVYIYIRLYIYYTHTITHVCMYAYMHVYIHYIYRRCPTPQIHYTNTHAYICIRLYYISHLGRSAISVIEPSVSCILHTYKHTCIYIL